MGNHTAGAMIAKNAELAWVQLRPGMSALIALDHAVESARRSPGFTPDAEFEASHPTKPGQVNDVFNDWRDPHPASPLGMLMVEAFAPNGLRDLHRYWPMIGGAEPNDKANEAACDTATEHWWREVNEPFRQRYGLC